MRRRGICAWLIAYRPNSCRNMSLIGRPPCCGWAGSFCAGAEGSAGAKALLQQIAQGLAKFAAERIVRIGTVRSGAVRAVTNPVWSEQAGAHLPELGIGRIRGVEDARHVGIDAWVGPGSVDGDRDAEAHRVRGTS